MLEVGLSGTPRDVATGETDLKGQKSEVMVAEEIAERPSQLGALVVVDGAKLRSSGCLERNKESDGRE